MLGLGDLLCLGGLHSWVLLVNLLNHTGFDGLIVVIDLCGVFKLDEGLDLGCPNVGRSSLLNLSLPGSFYLNVVLGGVGPRGLDSFGFTLGNFVINSSFTSSKLTSMSA